MNEILKEESQYKKQIHVWSGNTINTDNKPIYATKDRDTLTQTSTDAYALMQA